MYKSKTYEGYGKIGAVGTESEKDIHEFAKHDPERYEVVPLKPLKNTMSSTVKLENIEHVSQVD
jgi:hypothetical protein